MLLLLFVFNGFKGPAIYIVVVSWTRPLPGSLPVRLVVWLPLTRTTATCPLPGSCVTLIKVAQHEKENSNALVKCARPYQYGPRAAVCLGRAGIPNQSSRVTKRSPTCPYMVKPLERRDKRKEKKGVWPAYVVTFCALKKGEEFRKCLCKCSSGCHGNCNGCLAVVRALLGCVTTLRKRIQHKRCAFHFKTLYLNTYHK